MKQSSQIIDKSGPLNPLVETARKKAFFEMNLALINKRETDIRRSMAEAVANYPNSLKQRKIVLR